MEAYRGMTLHDVLSACSVTCQTGQLKSQHAEDAPEVGVLRGVGCLPRYFLSA